MINLIDDASLSTAAAGTVTPVAMPTVQPPNALNRIAAGAFTNAKVLTPETSSAIGVPTVFSAVASGSLANSKVLTPESVANIAVPKTLNRVAAGSIAVPIVIGAIAARVIPNVEPI